MKHFIVLVVFGLFFAPHFFLPAAVAQDSQFEKDVQAVVDRHSADFEKASALATGGDVETANKMLLALIDTDKSPQCAFIVANMLYKIDPDTSYALHKQAFNANPGEPAINLEWAMELHRKGKYAEAIPFYQKIAATNTAPQYNALLAECFIRQGKLKEAVAAWDAADHPNHHTGIDFAICEIHGELSPLRRRSDLLQRLKKSEPDVCEKLIDLDLHMDQDWWNSSANKNCLAQDLQTIENTLGKESARLKAIQCMATISGDDQANPATIKTKLKQAGLLLDDGKLPESSLVASRLIDAVLESQLDTRENLLQRFEAELLARAKSQQGDVDALNILCALCLGDKPSPKLSEYDRYGWDRYKDPHFAASFVVGLSQKGPVTIDTPELKNALKQFPDDNMVNGIAIHFIGPENASTDMLVSAIESEYHKLSGGMGGYPDSYTLKQYYSLLKKKL